MVAACADEVASKKASKDFFTVPSFSGASPPFRAMLMGHNRSIYA
jgi:hypothetical protein